MGQTFPELAATHRTFIGAQKIFFVASAAPTGRVNVSPKGMDSFRILNAREVAYLDVTGSGAETAAHLLASPDRRLTIMFCAFDGAPRILRLFGAGRSLHRGSDEYHAHIGNFRNLPGARQIIHLEIELVQTSCGMGVPLFDYREDRDQLSEWARGLGPDGVDAYQARKNATSLDGLPTGLVPDAMRKR